jgi:phosphate transport system substrate-binding protein
MGQSSKQKVMVGLLSLVISGCGGGAGASGPKGEASGTPVKLQGAGASFPAPIYIQWFKNYRTAHPSVTIDYQSVGSGQGVKSFIDGTVDFGASDAAMSEEEVSKVPQGVVMIPMTAGSIAIAYNLEGVKDLKLSREAYSGIFLGKITKWDDPAIAKTNPGVKLPATPINVIVRMDSSGTTFVFTKHLSAISPEFAQSPGTNKMPNWPAAPTKSKGNEGVSSSLTTTPGSIGYIESAYAKKLNVALLENKSGEFVGPTAAAGAAALESAEMPSDLLAWLPDPEGKTSYPIVTYTWLLCYQKNADPKKADTIKEVIKYCLTTGQESSDSLGYIPIPKKTVDKILPAIDKIGYQAKAAE